MATCSTNIENALKEAKERAVQDTRRAQRILDQVARNQCSTWDPSTFPTGSAETFEIAQARFESVVGAENTKLRLFDTDSSGVVSDFERSAQLIDPARAPDRKVFDEMTTALSSQCDGGYKVLSRRNEKFPYQIVICESGAPPASHIISQISDVVCDGFRTRIVPAGTQSFTSSSDDDSRKRYVHTFVCMGKQASTSTEYKTGVESLLEDLRSIEHEEFEDSTTDLRHACACQMARTSSKLVCKSIRSFAQDVRSAGSETSSAAVLNLPQDKGKEGVLAYFAGTDESQASMDCSGYEVGKEAAACCPPSTHRTKLVDDYYEPCAGLAFMSSHMYGPEDGRHDFYFRKEFCKQCHRIKEGVHGGHKINLGLFKVPVDWALTAGKTVGAAAAYVGLGAIQFFSGTGAYTCEDCRLWKHCFDEEGYALPSFQL